MLKNFLFLFIFIFWYSTTIMFTTNLRNVMGVPISTVNNIIDIIILLLLMIQIVFFQSYKKRELVIIIGITIPIIIAAALSRQYSLLSGWMFIVAARNVDLDRVIRVAYKILLIMIPAIVFLCFIGFIEDRTLTRGDIQRFSLGFVHPNHLGMRIFQLILCHFYINKNKLGMLNFFFIISAIIFVIIIPNSQTAYICLTVFLVMILGYRYFINQRQILMEICAKCLISGYLLLNMVSIIFSYIDINKNVVLSQIDKWMSMRFSLCHKVWQLYGVSFFGQRIYISPEERKLAGITGSLWLDNAYVSMLLRYGVLVFLLFSICYLYLMKAMTAKKKYVLVIILFLYSLYGAMEPALYMITHNIFLIAFSEILYNKCDKEI